MLLGSTRTGTSYLALQANLLSSASFVASKAVPFPTRSFSPLVTTTATTTSLAAALNDDNSNDNGNITSSLTNETAATSSTQSTTTTMLPPYSPRANSCLLMSLAMALHFGGYEFARSGCLALFTSSSTGFVHASAYPLAIGLVTPASLVLLYWYGLILKAKGPRRALYETTAVSVAILALGTATCHFCQSVLPPSQALSIFSKLVVAALFVFQNSYAHLLYTQQWSFLGSVMTPTEGTRWFSPIAGLSSLVCTITATLTHMLSKQVGLLGLIVGTCVTLAMSMVVADRAYQLAQDHGFDPSPEMSKKSSSNKNDTATRSAEKEESLLDKTGRMFKTSPTLAGLFGEVISFQSLSTVLSVCFVRQLKDTLPIDTDRAAFTGKFYAMVNGSSALMQFLVLPLARKYLEPQWVYRFLPFLLMPLLTYSAVQPTSTLWIAAVAFFALKSTDYSIRNVANEMVYQPLDFDARYLGKEVIGVFANRFGKSGMSLILSGLTALLPSGWMGARQLSQLAVIVGAGWSTCSVYLSKHVVTNREAEAKVQERKQKQEGLQTQMKEDADDAKKTQ